jgi:hypothetical protein
MAKKPKKKAVPAKIPHCVSVIWLTLKSIRFPILLSKLNNQFVTVCMIVSLRKLMGLSGTEGLRCKSIALSQYEVRLDEWLANVF